MALQLRDEAQPVAVVVEAAVPGHAGVERVLAGVAERGVAEIVAERDALGEILVQREGPRQRTRELGDLDGVGQAGAEMIALVMYEHLRLVGEAAEGGGMDDAVAVALERRAGRRVRLGDQTPARGRGVGGEAERNAAGGVRVGVFRLRFRRRGLSWRETIYSGNAT